MRTIKGYEEVVDFIMELRKKRIFFEYGKAERPVEDYWSEIPLNEQTFDRLYEALEKKLNDDGFIIILPEDSISDKLKEQLIIATLPFDNLKNTIKIMVHDDKYLASIKEEVGRIIYLVGLLALDNQEEDAITLMDLAESCGLYTALESNKKDVEYAYNGCLNLAAQLIDIFQDEFENANIKYCIIDSFELINSKEDFVNSDAYKKMYSFNSKRAELIKRLIFLANKIGMLLN